MHRGLVAKITVGVALIAALGTSPAFASVDASRAGSKSWANASAVYNKDTAADKNFTSAPWLRSSGATGSLVNRSGYNATVNRAVTNVTHVKACVSRPAPLAMACTGWNQG